MKRSTANTTACGCCGRRLPRKRVRAFCSRPCQEVAQHAAQSARRLARRKARA